MFSRVELILTGQSARGWVGRAGHRFRRVVPQAVGVVREAGRFGDGGPSFLPADVGQRLVPAGRPVRVVPAGLCEALVAAVRVGLVLAPAGPEGQRLALALDGQVVVGGAGRVLVEGGRVGRVAPLLRVADDARLGLVALGRDVQRRRVGAHGRRRGAGRGRRRGGGRGRRRAARGRRVRLLVQRAADAVHHAPPGLPGGVPGGGRWRHGGPVAGAEAPDMVVRVQGGGRASHG